MAEDKTIGTALDRAVKELKKARIEDPEEEALYLASGLLGLRRHEIFLGRAKPLGASQEGRLDGYIKRRASGEPPQYILGETEFHGLKFKVTPATLIPRPETELLVDEAVKAASAFKGGLSVIDLCTGSGCIAVTVAKEVPGARLFATDISHAALQVARKNAETNAVSDRITFLEGDLFSPLEGAGIKGGVHMILSNPPYVPDAEFQGLQREVRDFEPKAALAGGKDGLEFIRRIMELAPEFLVPGGYLIMEMGFGQAGAVRDIAERQGRLDDIKIIKDLSGIDRILRARLKS